MTRDHNANNDVRGRIDQVKGILACLIIVRHVDGILELVPWLMVVLSAFCSYSFFLLGFLSDRQRQFWDQLRYCHKKLFKPYILFFTSSCILFFVIVSQINIKSAVINYFIGLSVQSAETLKASSGFSLFWFIPCYVLLTLLRSIGAKNKYLYYGVLLIALAFHFGIAWYLSSICDTFPFSFHVALYCYPVCLIFNKIKSFLMFNRYVKYVSAAAFILSCVYIVKSDSAIFFSSSIFPIYTNPLGILIHDVCVLSCIGTFCLIYDFLRSGFVMKAGRFSFEFYLIHQFASYLVIYTCGTPRGFGSILHAGAVIAMTMLAVLGLHKFGAYKYIFSTDHPT